MRSVARTAAHCAHAASRSGGNVTFWNWRRSGAASSQGAATAEVATELAPIELYTADARIVGWIEPNGRRVTDVLNAQPELRLWRPSPGPIDVPGDLEGDVTIPATDNGAGEWQTLPTARVILAMPPEWRASRQLRLHRRLRRAALTAGPFSVTGNVHLPPGAEVGPHLLRGQPFMPLTDAYLLHSGEPHFEHVVSVVIVNAAHVGQIVSLVTLA
jgi:hypothetical protein